MPAQINYKNKYLELRSKYIGDIDMAFRLGYEQGVQGAQQQQAQMEQEQQAQAQGMNGGAPPFGSEGGESVGQPESQLDGQPSELDQHIGKLESMLGGNPDQEIKKSLHALVTLRKSEKQALELRKSAAAIPGIVKALHKPAFKMSVQASHNLNDNAKKTATLQHKIVNDIFKSWQEQESKTSKDIVSILEAEALLKG